MNYTPNTNDWRIGDYVIHDADAKRVEMLMRVIGFKGDTALTRYVQENAFVRDATRIYSNPPNFLHDPARWDIAVPKKAASL